MHVGDVMNRNAIRISLRASLAEAASLVSKSQVSDLMVIEDDGRFVGVLSEGDLIRAALPNYHDLVRDGSSVVGAFQVFIEKGAELAGNPIEPLVIRAPITLGSADELIKAATTMVNRQIRVLPVVDDGRLVGTLSRGDLCHAVLGGR